MKGLKKLALATAVAAAPFAQAEMTAMDDALLGEMTGQAGLTIDINLDMSIAEVRYADVDGEGDDVQDAGYLTFSNIVINGDQGNGTQAEIRGVSIDADGNDGLVIGFGQIGGESIAAQASAATAVATSDYWTGVNVTADFGINGTQAGSFEIKDFTNFVPNALAMEGVQKFGYAFVDTTGAVTGTPGTQVAPGTAVALTNDATGANLASILGATSGSGLIAQEFTYLVGNGAAADEATYTQAKLNVLSNTDQATVAGSGDNGFAAALTAGTHVDAFVAIQAGGAVGTEGLTINAEIGFVIQEMSYIDDGNKFGVHNFTMFDTDETTGEITGFTVTGLQIDVVTRTADSNSQSTAALQISGLNTNGTIAMGDIFVGDHTNGSLGALAIRDIDMSNTEILIYGH